MSLSGLLEASLRMPQQSLRVNTFQQSSKSKEHNMKKIITIATALMLIICSILFSKTRGLMDSYGNVITETYMSSTNDEACIIIAYFLFLPFILLVFTIKKRIAVWEFVLENLILFLQLLFLIIIDIGSIPKTIAMGNIPLLFWCISYVALFIEVYAFFIYERVSNKKANEKQNKETTYDE